VYDDFPSRKITSASPDFLSTRQTEMTTWLPAALRRAKDSETCQDTTSGWKRRACRPCMIRSTVTRLRNRGLHASDTSMLAHVWVCRQMNLGPHPLIVLFHSVLILTPNKAAASILKLG
jgi:hypothetical protein